MKAKHTATCSPETYFSDSVSSCVRRENWLVTDAENVCSLQTHSTI